MKINRYLLIAIAAMVMMAISCSKEVKIELTPECLIYLNSLSSNEISKKLVDDGWKRTTKFNGGYGDGYIKLGTNGAVEIRDEASKYSRVGFSTESDGVYQQWHNELEKLGYKFSDVSEFKGIHELKCDPESDKHPVIMLVRSTFYEDAECTIPIGNSYLMYIIPHSEKSDK